MADRRLLLHALHKRMLAFALLCAVVAAVAAALTWTLKPAVSFEPLSFPERLALSDGSGGPPSHIASGQPLTFAPVTFCNSRKEALKGSAQITIISTEQPPQASVAVLAGLPTTIAPGCTGGHALDLALPTPLPSGTWELVLTITATLRGHTQVLSNVSLPFVVTGAAS